MKVLIRKLNEKAVIPSRGSDSAAGYDLCALLEYGSIQIRPHQTAMIGTGLSVAIPDGYFGGIFARSGLASKNALRPANCVGVIDPDYRGEIKVALHNDSNESKEITDGQRIAQLLILPCIPVEWDETDMLPGTERADGGFGSTGR